MTKYFKLEFTKQSIKVCSQLCTILDGTNVITKNRSPRMNESFVVSNIFRKIIFTGHNKVVAKVMFLLVSVILLTGGSASVHAGIPPPRSRHPPGADPPGADTPLRADIPGADPPGADTPKEQTPP